MIEHQAVSTDVPLASMTTYKVGGQAAYFAEPADLAELRDILGCVEPGTQIVVLGRGSNVVIADGGIDTFYCTSVDQPCKHLIACIGDRGGVSGTKLPHVSDDRLWSSGFCVDCPLFFGSLPFVVVFRNLDQPHAVERDGTSSTPRSAS